MMKKTLISLLFIGCVFLITGCNKVNGDNIVSKDYISKNSGRFCSKYAISKINKETEIESGGHFALFKNVDNNDYEKMYDIDITQFTTGNLLISDNYIFLFDSAPKFADGYQVKRYPINSDKSKEEGLDISVDNKEIYVIDKIYGIKGNWIYISYYTYENYNNGSVNISYGKLNFDLNKYEKLNAKTDVPTSFDFLSC